jgi:hypothetical protein
MNTFKHKLKSRKFWTAAVGIIMGIAMVFGLDENTASIVSGAVVSLASVVTYIYTEGRIDAASASNAAQNIQDAIDAIELIED